MTPLQKAAQALIGRWESPTLFIDSEVEALGKALEDDIMQSTGVVAWLRHDRFKAMTDDEKSSWIESGNGDVVEDYTIPLYLQSMAAKTEGLVSAADDVVTTRNWDEDADHENGMYVNTCHNCKTKFIGHKRRITCKVCATEWHERKLAVNPQPPQ